MEKRRYIKNERAGMVVMKMFLVSMFANHDLVLVISVSMEKLSMKNCALEI